MFFRRCQQFSILLLLSSAVSIAPASTIDLPATGQQHSYHSRDDGKLQKGISWPEPRFVDNGDGTLSDTLTGLMWIRDASCGDSSLIYPGGTVLTWEENFSFVENLNSKTGVPACKEYTAKHRDWRVPNIVEVMSLMPYGLNHSQSYIDGLLEPPPPSRGFANLGHLHQPVWTSTSSADGEQVWVVDFHLGKNYTADKIQTEPGFHIFSAVRIETQSQLQPTGQQLSFINNDDGDDIRGRDTLGERFVASESSSVVDRRSGLRWLDVTQCLNGNNWQSAIDFIEQQNKESLPFVQCINEDFNIRTWRMPNIVELQSLIDYSATSPSIPVNDHLSLPASGILLSSTGAKDEGSNYVWGIDLDNGETLPAVNRSQTNHLVLAVSGPASFADIKTVDSLSFGHYFISDEPARILPLEIENSGSSILEIGLITIEGKAESDFSPGRDQCSNITLSPDDTCVIEIEFQPKKIGDRTATVIIPSNALGVETYEVELDARGLDPNEAGNSACFIATAAFDSDMAPQVKRLREFRDEYLIGNPAGRFLVKNYYRLSPPLADFIRDNETAKNIARGFIQLLVWTIEYGVILFLALLVTFGLKRISPSLSYKPQ